MPKKKQDPQLLELARRGAQAQLADLVHEMRMLLDLFPNLRDSYDPDELPVTFLLKRGSARAAKKAERDRRRKRTWTPAQRRAAAERMREYWTARRRKKAR